MNDELVSAARVADLLKVSLSQVGSLVKRGILRPHRSSPKRLDQKLFLMTDVASLIEIRRRGNNPEAAFVEARQAAMEARALRQEVERMRFVLGLDVLPLAVDRDTVVSLLLKAEDALHGPPIREAEALLEWARTFHAISEVHFEAITFHTEQREPWRAFLALARKLCSGENVMSTRNDPELYSIYRLLNLALRRLRQTSYFHIRDSHGERMATRMFPEVKGCPHEDVIALSFSNTLWEAPPAPSTPDPLSLTTSGAGSPGRSHGSGG